MLIKGDLLVITNLQILGSPQVLNGLTHPEYINVEQIMSKSIILILMIV